MENFRFEISDQEREAVKAGILAGHQWLPREVALLLHSNGWDSYEKLYTMLAVCGGESALFDEALHENDNGTVDVGMFQLNSSHMSAWGFNSFDDFKAMAYDPHQAVKRARGLYVMSGYAFDAWYAYANGGYKVWLSKAILGVANFAAQKEGLAPVPKYEQRG